MKIEGIIFDCDGLMFDTERIGRQNWMNIIQKYDLDADDSFFSAITGSGPTFFEEIMNSRPDIKVHLPEIEGNRFPIIAKAIEERGNINKEGLVELLKYLKESGQYKVCIASSSPVSYVEWLVSTIGYDYPFDYIIGGDNVEKAKPDPEIFLKVAQQIDVRPENILVIEDSKNGHIAAKRANMHRMFIQDMIVPDEEFREYIEFEEESLLGVIDFLKDHNE